MNVKSALYCSEELRRLSEKNGSQIHYYTFQTDLLDFWASFLPFGITRCCYVHFTVQWGLSKAVWKKWISKTLLYFSNWIARFLRFLLSFWNYKKYVKSNLPYSKEFRRLSENNGYQIHYYNLQTELLDFWASFLLYNYQMNVKSALHFRKEIRR